MAQSVTGEESVVVSIILVGDSDIARWPPSLLPFTNVGGGGGNKIVTTLKPIVSGHNGATLSQILPHVQVQMEESMNRRNESPSNEMTILIVCAGENDVGSVPLWESEAACLRLLQETVGKYNNNNTNDDNDSNTLSRNRLVVIFLGPKLEPWLQDDMSSRKRYIQMSRAFQRQCEQESFKDYVIFVDCLTMFCASQTANEPGALFKAKPNPAYFESDQLHLSTKGYQIWKEVIEHKMHSLLQSSRHS